MSDLPRYLLKEVAKHNGKDGVTLWLVINDMVYDVTDYRNKHPGGAELLEEYAGQDATRGFNESGHSSDAKKIMKKHLVGELEEEDKMSNRKKKDVKFVASNTETTRRSRGFLSVLCGKCVS